LVCARANLCHTLVETLNRQLPQHVSSAPEASSTYEITQVGISRSSDLRDTKEITVIRSTQVFRVIFVLTLLVSLLTSPASSQDGPFEDSFDRPELQGWQHNEGAYVQDGLLRLEPGGFASPEGVWGGFELTLRAQYTGLGELVLASNMNAAGGSILLFNGSRFQVQRELDGKITNIGEPVPFELPEGEWFQMTYWVGLGERLVFVNEEPIASFVDQEELVPGAFGFEVLGDMVLEIDHVIVFTHDTHELDSETPDDEPADTPEEPPAATGTFTWIRLGGPPGGLGYDIRYNFDDHDTWYVTDANAGVHISTDDGLTWHQSNTGIETVGGASGDAIPIFSLTVDPHNPQILWAGTDMSGRIYKSTDSGSTWEAKDQGVIREHNILLSFRGFTVDPTSSETVYAMGELQRPGNNVWGLGVGGVVYKTTNGGESWTRIWHGPIPASLARYMWINPDDPQVLYVSTGIFDRGAVGEVDIESTSDPFGGLGVLKSIDGGQTWEVLGKENGLDFLYIGSLFMHPEDPDTLFAAAGHVAPELAYQQWEAEGHSPMGIYRTTDGGESWTQVLEASEARAQAFSAIEICPGAPEIMYAGSDAAIYYSDDGGDTWTRTTPDPFTWGPPGVRAGWPIDLQCDPEDTNRIFANNYSGGNFLSKDGGKTWVTASDGYSGAQIIGIAVDPFNPARVFVGGRSGGWYSENAGRTWQGIRDPNDTKPLAGGEVGGVAIDSSRPNHIFIGTSEYILEWDSMDEPVWQTHWHNPPYGPETSVIVIAPSDPNMIYAGSANHNTMVHAESYESGQGVFLSRDGGATWEVITGESFSAAKVTDLAVDPNDAGTLYVACFEGLYKTMDYGSTWTQVGGLPQGASVRTIAVHPTDPQHLIAGLPNQGLYLSQDGGNSWKPITAGLEPNGNHRDILFDPSDSTVVYTSDIISGVYRSEDAGETWRKINDGLTNRAATALSLSADGQHLYAATSGGGVFRLDLNGKPPQSTGITLFDDSALDEDQIAEIEESVPEQEEPASEPEPSDAESADQGGRRFSLPCLGSAIPLLLIGIFAAYLHDRGVHKD
jgi:photosystem II stability/assembly factor-like uncharacterized protein